MPPRRRKHVPAGAHESVAHLSPAQRQALTAPRVAVAFPPMGEPLGWSASIAEGLRDLGLARLRDGDEAGAQRLLYGAETLREQGEYEDTAGDDRLTQLREFARAFIGELTGADDDAIEIDHAHVPDDVTTIEDPGELHDVIADLLAEIKDLRKVESAYVEFRRTLGVLADKYRIEDEL